MSIRERLRTRYQTPLQRASDITGGIGVAAILGALALLAGATAVGGRTADGMLVGALAAFFVAVAVLRWSQNLDKRIARARSAGTAQPATIDNRIARVSAALSEAASVVSELQATMSSQMAALEDVRAQQERLGRLGRVSDGVGGW